MIFDQRGNLYVANRGDGTIREFGRDGTDRGSFRTTGLTTPVGMAFGPNRRCARATDHCRGAKADDR